MGAEMIRMGAELLQVELGGKLFLAQLVQGQGMAPACLFKILLDDADIGQQCRCNQPQEGEGQRAPFSVEAHVPQSAQGIGGEYDDQGNGQEPVPGENEESHRRRHHQTQKPEGRDEASPRPLAAQCQDKAQQGQGADEPEFEEGQTLHLGKNPPIVVIAYARHFEGIPVQSRLPGQEAEPTEGALPDFAEGFPIPVFIRLRGRELLAQRLFRMVVEKANL